MAIGSCPDLWPLAGSDATAALKRHWRPQTPARVIDQPVSLGAEGSTLLGRLAPSSELAEEPLRKSCGPRCSSPKPFAHRPRPSEPAENQVRRQWPPGLRKKPVRADAARA